MTFKALFHPQKHDTLLSNKKEKLRKTIIVTVVGFARVSEINAISMSQIKSSVQIY